MKKIAVICLAMSTSVTFAKVCVWTGNGTPNPNVSNQLLWSDSGNWEGGNVPANGDTVSFTEKNTTIHRLNYSLALENLFYTNTVGNTATCSASLTLTGTESVLYVTTSAAGNWNIPVKLEGGAKLLVTNSVGYSFKTPFTLSGDGEFTKRGNGEITFLVGNGNFDGTMYFYGKPCVVKVMNAVNNVFGSSKAKAYFYGDGSSSIDARYGGRFDSGLELHDITFLTYRTATFNGDVTLAADSSNYIYYLQGISNSTYYTESSLPAMVFNAALKNNSSPYSGRPLFYAYTASAAYPGTTFNVYLNGSVDFGGKPIETYHKQTAKDRVFLHVNTRPRTTSTTGVILCCGDKVFCGVENAFEGKDIQFGASKMNSSVVFDMCGRDQKVRQLLFTQTDGYTTEGSVTSSGGPAMLSTTAHKYGYERMLSLDGEASFTLNKGTDSTANNFVFPGGTTTGWIFSNYPRSDLTAGAFPNLGGIGLSATGVAYVNATTALKNGVKFDFSSRTPNYCYLRVDTGVNINASQVVDGNIDVPAGVYCRAGAGVAGATEAAWLGGGAGYDGTVTIAAHDPVLVWTGAGDRSISGAANWGANESPDLTDSSLTLDFRRATAEAPVVISGRIAPACVLTSGDVSQGSPTFSGDGTLALSGTGVITNNFAFAGSASFEWNGPGTLCLKEPSTSSGTLTVNGGTVVLLSGSAWAGDAQVAAGATLAVEGGRDSAAFSAASKVRIYGMLELGSGVEETVGALFVDGRLARRLRTYGSTESGATVQDDSRFAGVGTIRSCAVTGITVIVF